MFNSSKNLRWQAGAASLALCLSSAPAFAQAGPQPTPESEVNPPPAETVVVLGQITYRNRTEEVAPTLDYGLEYFQRFEPLTVGDALKRVPSVTFLSDVLESDGVRLRGLDPAYTQILINGEKVPGAGSSSGAFGNGADGSFFVDRIPAELIERVEIVRSASANRSGDAMAGALNIVLRDGYSIDGGYVRAGALGFNDGRVRETYGGVWGGAVGPGRLLIGANVQGRHNPKEKLSKRYSDPGDTTLDDIETQTDKRDGTDYSANFAYQVETGSDKFAIDGFYVKTDRTQDEDSIEYLLGQKTPAQLSTINDNDVSIDQESWSLNGAWTFDLGGGETKVKLGYAHFENNEYEFEDESEYLRDTRIFPEVDRYTGELQTTNITDGELKAKVEHRHDLSEHMKVEFGLQYERKERDNYILSTTDATRTRVSLANGTNVGPGQGARPPGVGAPGLSALRLAGVNTIERTQTAPYAMLTGDAGAISWEAGVRWEFTGLDVNDQVAAAISNRDDSVLLPSAHLRWDLTDDDRITASAARTVRNPSFDFLSPALLLAELGDNDFRGDPNLDPEKAWGLDVGYEKRLGATGVAGVNVFYRKVEDLIELFNTGAPGSEDSPTDRTWIYSARNTGDGAVWGVELDYSAPLSFIGLPDTGVFLNYSWLDSDVDDEFGSRRFNSQADYVYNVGFIHDMPQIGVAFGLTYRKQGDSVSRVVGEEVTTSYEGVLEAFVEKRIGKNFTVRLTGSNLTDGSKDEYFNKFTTVADQRAHGNSNFDEYEIETESAGPAWQLIGRLSF